jgi:hypothetical protein
MGYCPALYVWKLNNGDVIIASLSGDAASSCFWHGVVPSSSVASPISAVCADIVSFNSR